MASGNEPAPADLRRIVDLAIPMIAWIDTRLGALQAGHPARLPLFVAKALALRLEFEARALLDEARWARDGEIGVFLTSIQSEIAALTIGVPVYALAHDLRALVEQYVFLYRSLRSPATMVEFSDGRTLPYYPEANLSWDDGLDRIRELVAAVQPDTAPGLVELRTLPEHRGWEALAGHRATTDELDVEEIRAALGLPDDAPASADTLRRLVAEAPPAAKDARARLTRETR
jgi:hypothetical protein